MLNLSRRALLATPALAVVPAAVPALRATAPVMAITGSAGRVGTALRAYWGGRYKIIEIDKVYSPEQDLTSAGGGATWGAVIDASDVLVHLAVEFGDGYDTLRYNTTINLNVLERFATRRVGGRILYASSIRAVGSDRYPPNVQRMTNYGAMKRAFEAELEAWAVFHSTGGVARALRIGHFNPAHTDHPSPFERLVETNIAGLGYWFDRALSDDDARPFAIYDATGQL